MFYVDILSVAPDRPGVATGPRGCSALFYTFLHCTPDSVLGEGVNDTNAEVLMASGAIALLCFLGLCYPADFVGLLLLRTRPTPS